MLLQQSLRDLGSTANDYVDLTAMVDVVFQLLTFLLLTYQVSAEAAVQMPVAKNGIGVEENEALVITVAAPEAEGQPAVVYAGTKVDPEMRLEDADAIELVVREAVTLGKNRVVIQADGSASHGDVLRVAGAAGKVEGISVHIGVEEPKR
jgi:biopolymer transport protein ExbD